MSKYIKEELESLLRKHKEHEAQLTEIDLKLEEYKERLEYAGTVYQDTEEETIENLQLHGKGFDEVPSNTNKVSDKVSSTAMIYKTEMNHINNEDRTHLESKIREFEKEKDILNKKVVRVKNLLDRVTIDERYVINLFYLEESKWDYIEKKYFEEFERHKSIKQLQTYRDNALDKMLNIINIGLQ